MSEVDADLLARVTAHLETGQAALAHGDANMALAVFTAMVGDIPNSAEAYYWLYSAHLAAGKAEATQSKAALASLCAAVTLHGVDLMPSLEVDIDRFAKDADYDVQLYQTCYNANYPALASVFSSQAIKLGMNAPTFVMRHALALQHQSRAEESVGAYMSAFRAHPAAALGQYYLYSLFYVPDGVKRYAKEARAWADRFAKAVAKPRWAPKPLEGRKLKIGYVAPNFSNSQIYQFILPVLEAHDPAVVEVTLYTADAKVEKNLPCARMVSIGSLNDDQAVDLIRADELDVLIDTWGHTSGSRIGIFARRAAPVQAAWINFVQTTGLEQMDYVLHSDSMAAPGTDELFTETVWRMGDITVPYRASPHRLPPVPPPAIYNGYITFASFNHPAKISDATVANWSRILKGRPNSVLLLKYRYFADPILQRIFQARFAAHSIDAGQVIFEGHSTGDDYMQSFRRIDVCLDPSPCPGGTTTCDALSNGVPVLTLAGDNFFARIGVQGVAVCGLPDLVAESWDDYVDIALKITEDMDTLTALRARVRPGFEASAYRDEVGFTRKLEATFAEMAQLAIIKFSSACPA